MPRAWVSKGLGAFKDVLAVKDMADADPPAGYVALDVLTCAVEFVQTLLIEGSYQVKPPPGFTPGTEVVGVVTKVGADVTSLRAGDLVLASLLMGGFSERVIVDARSAMPLPASSDVLRVPGLVAYATSLFALRHRAKLQDGETVLVLGAAGAIGSTAVEVAKLLGAARVVAAVSSQAKADYCVGLGADATINYSSMSATDFRAALKKEFGQRGVDVVYDPVGGALAEPSARALAYGGRYVSLGFASGGADSASAIPRLPANLFLLKNAQLLGSGLREWMVKDPEAASAMNKEIVELWCSGKLSPPAAAAYDFDRLPEAFEDLRNRKTVGRAVLTTPRYSQTPSRL